jgi:hypothetical protein
MRLYITRRLQIAIAVESTKIGRSMKYLEGRGVVIYLVTNDFYLGLKSTSLTLGLLLGKKKIIEATNTGCHLGSN